jgi:hypothetical protein
MTQIDSELPVTPLASGQSDRAKRTATESKKLRESLSRIAALSFNSSFESSPDVGARTENGGARHMPCSLRLQEYGRPVSAAAIAPHDYLPRSCTTVVTFTFLNSPVSGSVA